MIVRVLKAPLVLLAGGASRRMGRPKGLLPFRDRTWLEAQLELFTSAGGERAIVVLSSIDAYGDVIDRLDAHVQLIEQPRPDDPPLSSLLLGLAEARGDAFVLPIDVPACASVFATLEGGLADHDAAVPVVGDRRAHPVLLSGAFAARLDERLDHALAKARVVEIPIDEPALRRNLNTQEAWSEWVLSADAARCYPPPP